MIQLHAIHVKILFFINAIIKDIICNQMVKRLMSLHYKGIFSVLQGQLV